MAYILRFLYRLTAQIPSSTEESVLQIAETKKESGYRPVIGISFGGLFKMS